MKSCEECKGECCRSFAIQIPRPEEFEDFDDIRWYFYHKPAFVYIDSEDDWIVEIPVKCSNLDDDGKCRIYDKKPSVCKSLDPETCSVNVNDVKEKFCSDSDYKKWLEKKHPLIAKKIYK
jgi:Fe-S-cluster containining protein